MDFPILVRFKLLIKKLFMELKVSLSCLVPFPALSHHALPNLGNQGLFAHSQVKGHQICQDQEK